VEFGVLGPVEARRDGRTLRLGGQKQRALLAMLVLNANKAVSRDRLIEALWDERQPAKADHALDTYVSRLRATLGESRVERRPPGYMLRVEADELDLDRFERLREQGREELAHGDAARAAATLRSALALWRGAALADVLYEPFASAEAERLEEQRLGALEERVEADLALGRAGQLIPELEALVREHPLRERLVRQLMLALYRAGRQAEALAAFQAARRRLAEELGLEPSPQLQRLERQMLEQDPDLVPVVRSSGRERTERRRRRLIVAALAGAAVAAGAAIGVSLGTRGTDSNVAASANGLIGLSVDSPASARGIRLGSAPAAIIVTKRSLWAASPDTGTVSRIDLSAGAVADRIPVGSSPGALAAGAGSIWTVSGLGESVKRIDPGTGTVTQTVSLGGARAGALAFARDGLWIADLTDNSLLEVDADSGSVRRTIELQLRPTAFAVGAKTIWFADYEANELGELDLRTGQTIATVHVGNGPSALALSRGAVWVTNALDSTVMKVDPLRGSVAATIPVGSGPTAVAASGGFVWVANEFSSTVSRIDASRNAVVATARVPGYPAALALTSGTVWVGFRSLGRHRGGTLRLLHSQPITIDPALQVDLLPLQSDDLTADGLVTYNHVPGPAGLQLVPDLAVNLPVPTDGGTTYTFRLRPGIRYSDGRLVRPADFRRSIERLFRLRGPAHVSFTGLLGAGACARVDSGHCDLSKGIVTDERSRTIAFHLRAPDPDFLSNLANRPLPPVPPGASMRAVRFTPLPATGPYKIAAASRREIRYVRNPFFREWSHAAQPDGTPDQIVMRFGLSPAQEVRAIEEGRADWSADPVPANLLPALKRRFPGRLHTFSIPTTDFFTLNTTLPPFDDIRVRRALNLAIDRRHIVRLYGGMEVATPTCQILPPGIPGYRRYCPYTRSAHAARGWSGPDFARAQRLVAASGTRGARVLVWGWTDFPTISPTVVKYVADVLRRLGYRAGVRLVPHAFFDRRHANVLKRVQLIPHGWGDTPYGFFATWFTCGAGFNHGWFCDRRVARANLQARSLNSTNPRAAASVWAGLDRRLVDEAAWVPMIDERGVDFVSARVRDYQFHPYWGLIADQLSLR
jgi:peptide/nickel transport system substrate-binding protein